MPPGPLRLSIVIVAHRSRGHLPGCLAALPQAASPLSFDVTVVDNASNDGSVEWLRSNHPGVRVIENERNTGFATAANQGARETHGERVLFLNPDVTLAPESLVLLDRALDEPHVGLVSPQLRHPDGRLQLTARPAPTLRALAFEALLLHNLFPRSPLHPYTARLYSGPTDVPALCGASLLVRRDCLVAVGGFDERFFLYFEDVDLGLRARAAGWSSRIIPEARAVHAEGGSSFQDRRSFWLHYNESRAVFLDDRFSGDRRILARGLQWLGEALRASAFGVVGLATARQDLRQEAAHHAAVAFRLLRPRRTPLFLLRKL